MAQGKNRKTLIKKSRKGVKDFPLAVIAFYGPDNKRASKVVCSIFKHDGAEPEPMRKWFTESDARMSEKILGEITSFIEEHKVKSVGMMDKIIGCPHEEVIDYPEGESCPECPYWKNRDRFTDEVIH